MLFKAHKRRYIKESLGEGRRQNIDYATEINLGTQYYQIQAKQQNG